MTLNFNEFYEQFWCFNLNGFKVQIATWCDLYAGQGQGCPSLFCTMTKFSRERPPDLINLHKWFVSEDTDPLQEQRIAQQMFALTRPCSGPWLAAPRSRDRGAASHWSAVLLLLLSALFRMFARVNKDKTGVARCWENVITVKENCIKPWTRVSQTLRWFEEG